MARFTVAALAVAALVLGQPCAAQDADPATTDAMARRLADTFAAAPLTDEQETRLPQAEAIVARAFPPGTYRKMMDESLAPMMSAITDSMKAMPMANIAALAGIKVEDIEKLGDAKIGEIMAIMDPAFDERLELTNQMTVRMVTDLMDEIEPSYRRGLARAYAVRFTEAELQDISVFFETDSGSRYAAQSMLIFADPQVMSVMGEMMPAMMERMPSLTADMTEAMKDLPPPKSREELTDADRAALARLLGVAPERLRSGNES